jgi:hypothetical protein
MTVTKKIIQINNIQYEVKAFHPTRFESNIYAVSFHEKDKPLLDKYNHLFQIESNNITNAINTAKEKLIKRLVK